MGTITPTCSKRQFHYTFNIKYLSTVYWNMLVDNLSRQLSINLSFQ